MSGALPTLEEVYQRHMRELRTAHGGGRPLVQAVVLPSFHDNVCITVSGGRIVHVTRQSRRRDAAELKTSRPTIDVADLESLLARIAALRIPPAPSKASGGLDGVQYQLHFSMGGSSFEESSFSWWHEPPPGWEELGSIVTELQRLCGLAP